MIRSIKLEEHHKASREAEAARIELEYFAGVCVPMAVPVGVRLRAHGGCLPATALREACRATLCASACSMPNCCEPHPAQPRTHAKGHVYPCAHTSPLYAARDVKRSRLRGQRSKERGKAHDTASSDRPSASGRPVSLGAHGDRDHRARARTTSGDGESEAQGGRFTAAGKQKRSMRRLLGIRL